MSNFDEQLRQLAADMSRARQLERQLEELCRRRDTLAEQEARLDKQRIKEERDAARMEGGSLAAFFYNVIGRRDEKLTRERQEAYEAAVRYDSARRQLEAVEQDIESAQTQLRALSGCEGRYRQALDRKAAAIKAGGGGEVSGLLALEERISSIDSRAREINEAILAGKAARRQTEAVLEALDSADGWGTYDVMGGGLLTNMIKHSYLDEAQEEIERLQILLGRFNTELADVSIYADVQVSVDGFMRFADFFFDGFFADLAVLDRIENSIDQVRATQTGIAAAIERLGTLLARTEAEAVSARESLDALIMQAQL